MRPWFRAASRWSLPVVAAALLHLGADAQELSREARIDSGQAEPAPPPDERDAYVAKVCSLIAREAEKQGLPKGFFARLIWQESRFRAGAISPKGAQGIAQFMPGTARERGLADPFNPTEALAASADFLAELRREFGSVGLAAAGYNAGPNRVRLWRAGRSGLPGETRAFVYKITGHWAEDWLADGFVSPKFVLAPATSFEAGCRSLGRGAPASPITAPFEQQPLLPWGVLITSHFSQAQAQASLERLKRAHAIVADHERIDIARRRNAARGRRAMYEVMLGVGSRSDGTDLCGRLRRDGGICMVVKN